MARSNAATAATADDLTAEEQAQLDQMRAGDAQPEPEPQPQPEPEPAPAPEPELGTDPQVPDRQKTVPLGHLQDERERRKHAEQRVAELQRNQQTLEERTNLLLQRFQQQPATPPAQPPALPDVATDPVGHIVGLLDQQRQRQDALTQWALQQEQRTIQQTNVGTVQDRALALEREFAAATPDYQQAVEHLAQSRRRELEAAGFTDPGERDLILRNEALQLAQRGIQSGRNPAEMIYALSKIRGYQAPAAAAAAQQQPTAAERIQQVRDGQQQSRGLGSTRGTGPAPLTAARLLEMSDKDFDAMMQTPEGRELLGS